MTIEYSTHYYKTKFDYLSAEGPLRTAEVEDDPESIGTSDDKGSHWRLSIPPEEADIWSEWRAAHEEAVLSLGAQALGAVDSPNGERATE